MKELEYTSLDYPKIYQPMKLGILVQAPCYCYPSGAMLCVDPQAEARYGGGGHPSSACVDDDLEAYSGWLKDFFQDHFKIFVWIFEAFIFQVWIVYLRFRHVSEHGEVVS